MNDPIGRGIARCGNRFALAGLVRERAEALHRGAAPRVVAPEGTKPVSLAIAEIAIGETSLRPHSVRAPAGRHGDRAEIRCSVCGGLATIRRKPGIAPQGRPPSRCAAHGLSTNWEQLAILSRDDVG